MDKSPSSIRRAINFSLPPNLCGNTRVLCGKRRKNGSCRCDACAYNISTGGLPLMEKALLLETIRR